MILQEIAIILCVFGLGLLAGKKKDTNEPVR